MEDDDDSTMGIVLSDMIESRALEVMAFVVLLTTEESFIPATLMPFPCMSVATGNRGRFLLSDDIDSSDRTEEDRDPEPSIDRFSS